jgi:hypothetical protein
LYQHQLKLWLSTPYSATLTFHALLRHSHQSSKYDKSNYWHVIGIVSYSPRYVHTRGFWASRASGPHVACPHATTARTDGHPEGDISAVQHTNMPLMYMPRLTRAGDG